MSEIQLKPRETRAVAALLTEPNLDSAAALAGIAPRSLRRWLQKPHFARALESAQQEAVGEALSRLRCVTTEAVEELRSLMHTASSEPVKLGAARTVIDLALRSAELDAISSRLDSLEQQVGAKH